MKCFQEFSGSILRATMTLTFSTFISFLHASRPSKSTLTIIPIQLPSLFTTRNSALIFPSNSSSRLFVVCLSPMFCCHPQPFCISSITSHPFHHSCLPLFPSPNDSSTLFVVCVLLMFSCHPIFPSFQTFSTTLVSPSFPLPIIARHSLSFVFHLPLGITSITSHPFHYF